MKWREHVLITGKPGVGKTTLIKLIIEGLRKREFKLAGFYTEELRESGRRIGFRIMDVSGDEEGILASVNGTSSHRIGKYQVDVGILNSVVARLSERIKTGSIDALIIDEVGPMELCSATFMEFAASSLRASHPPIIGTIKKRALDFLDSWSVAYRVDIITISERDRAHFGSIADGIVSRIKTGKYLST